MEPTLIEQIKILFNKLDRVQLASTFSALTTSPELQSNQNRLYALTSLALAYAKGNELPTTGDIDNAFNLLAETSFGKGEDPAENVFVSLVYYQGKNYRIFEGLWENSAFYLQRFLSIVEKMPDKLFELLKEETKFLLEISDLIILRRNLPTYCFGETCPLDCIPESVLQELAELKNVVTINEEDLPTLKLNKKNFERYQIKPIIKNEFKSLVIGDSILEKKLLLKSKNKWYVLCPDNISIIIRHAVVAKCASLLKLDLLAEHFVGCYYEYFLKAPFWGNLSTPPIHFVYDKECELTIAVFGSVVEEGKFLQVIIIADNFINANKNWTHPHYLGNKKLSETILQKIKDYQAFVKEKEGYKEGLTLVIHCGWGRACYNSLDINPQDDWYISIITAPDFDTLSNSRDFSISKYWKMLKAKRYIEKNGGFFVGLNGDINLYAVAQESDGHIIPHDALVTGEKKLNIPFFDNPTALLHFRSKTLSNCEKHLKENDEDRIVMVEHINSDSYFNESKDTPLYASIEDLNEGKLKVVFEGEHNDWWITIGGADDNRELLFEFSKIIHYWIPLVYEKLNSIYQPITKNLSWLFVFGKFDEGISISKPLEYETLKGMIECAVKDHWRVEINLNSAFMTGFYSSKNYAERAIVWAIVAAYNKIHSDNIAIESTVSAVVINDDAKQMHFFPAQKFLHFVGSILPKPMYVEKEDTALAVLGLGQQGLVDNQGNEIKGVEACRTFYRKLLDSLQCQIIKIVGCFNRKFLIMALQLNIEALYFEEERWSNTFKALLAQHNDKNDVKQVRANEISKIIYTRLGNRIAIEIAICESAHNAGFIPNKSEIIEIISLCSQMHELGGHSDLISFGVKDAYIAVSYFGQVLSDYSFTDGPAAEYGRTLENVFQKNDIENYEKLFEQNSVYGSVNELFDQEFLEAWIEIYGATPDEIRLLIDKIEDIAIKSNTVILEIPKSQLLGLVSDLKISENTVSLILDRFSLKPRPKWNEILETDKYRNKDWFPWKFRRRLSVVTLPIIALDNVNDPTYLISPNSFRNGFMYNLKGAWNCTFDNEYYPKNSKMNTLIGKRVKEKGIKFNKKVADKLTEYGWETEHDIDMAKIFNIKKDPLMGDIDVFARKGDRILFVECKDLSLAKSQSEIAEKIKEFRGSSDFTKPKDRDKLRRHIDRLTEARKHIDKLKEKYQNNNLVFEGHLVFSQTVPVLFSKEKEVEGFTVSTFEMLEGI